MDIYYFVKEIIIIIIIIIMYRAISARLLAWSASSRPFE